MSSQQQQTQQQSQPSTHNATTNCVPGFAQRQQIHDHSRPLPPPTSAAAVNSPFSTGQTTITTTTNSSVSSSSSSSSSSSTASFRSVSRSPVQNSTIVSRSPITSSSSTTATATAAAAATTTTTTNTGEVSLEAPRPDVERLANEYVETPFRPNQQQQQQQHNKEPVKSKHCATSKHHRRNGPIITKQPVSFTKQPSSRLAHQSAIAAASAGNQQSITAGLASTTADSNSLSIMCERCGRCRCESCREPAPLPSRWLCDNSCYCSAETVLDYASCLCCAKGLFYHCSLSSNDDATTCADEPCSCVGPRRAARWSCLSALALVLPCLLCYWPLKGCVALCEAGYAKHASQGCRCVNQQPEMLLRGEKRLLAPEQ